MEKFIVESVVHSEGTSIESWCEVASEFSKAKEESLDRFTEIIADHVISSSPEVSHEGLQKIEDTFEDFFNNMDEPKKTQIITDLTQNGDYSIVFKNHVLHETRILSIYIDEVLGNTNMSALVRIFKIKA